MYGARIRIDGEALEASVRVPGERRDDSYVGNNLIRSQSSNGALGEQERGQKCGNSEEQHDDEVSENRKALKGRWQTGLDRLLAMSMACLGLYSIQHLVMSLDITFRNIEIDSDP